MCPDGEDNEDTNKKLNIMLKFSLFSHKYKYEEKQKKLILKVCMKLLKPYLSKKNVVVHKIKWGTILISEPESIYKSNIK